MDKVLGFIPAELHDEARVALCNMSPWGLADVLHDLPEADRKAAAKAARELWSEWESE